jgi:ribosomal protein L25 (general stress protein Ctc)
MSKIKINYKRPSQKVKLLAREPGSAVLDGYVKGIIFGPDIKNNMSVHIPKNDLATVFDSYGIAGKNCKWELEIDGKKYSAIIKDLQFALLDNREFSHVDFYVPSEKKPFKIHVYPQIINPLVESSGTYKRYPAITKNLATNSIFSQERYATLKVTSEKIPFNMLVDINQLRNGETVFLPKNEFNYRRQDLLRVSG